MSLPAGDLQHHVLMKLLRTQRIPYLGVDGEVFALKSSSENAKTQVCTTGKLEAGVRGRAGHKIRGGFKWVSPKSQSPARDRRRYRRLRSYRNQRVCGILY